MRTRIEPQLSDTRSRKRRVFGWGPNVVRLKLKPAAQVLDVELQFTEDLRWLAPTAEQW